MASLINLSRGTRIPVYVAEHNLLAAFYLRHLLTRSSSVTLMQWESTDVQPSNQSGCIFIIDKATLPVSLRSYVHSVRIRLAGAKLIVIDRQYATKNIRDLLTLGVSGALAYEEVEQDLMEAVRCVWQGLFWIKTKAVGREIKCLELPEARQAMPNLLTTREREIIEFLERRLSNKQIGTELGISESTVKFHLSNIFSKLGVHDRGLLAETMKSISQPADNFSTI